MREMILSSFIDKKSEAQKVEVLSHFLQLTRSSLRQQLCCLHCGISRIYPRAWHIVEQWFLKCVS